MLKVQGCIRSDRVDSISFNLCRHISCSIIFKFFAKWIKIFVIETFANGWKMDKILLFSSNCAAVGGISEKWLIQIGQQIASKSNSCSIEVPFHRFYSVDVKRSFRKMNVQENIQSKISIIFYRFQTWFIYIDFFSSCTISFRNRYII